MKKHALLISVLMVVIIPGFIFKTLHSRPLEDRFAVMDRENHTVTKEIATDATRIRVGNGELIQQMDLEQYILGVVMGEMPAEFHTEALKAQAVATRTYTLRKLAEGGKHTDADVCTDPQCCQAYHDPKEFEREKGSEAFDKIRCAVYDTAGQILTYQGQIIEATYFSCSGGMTEDAAAVWGADIPYLRAKPSPGEEEARYYTASLDFKAEDFLHKLGIEEDACGTVTVSNEVYTAGGGIDRITICGKVFTGLELRQKLSLPSTAFSVEYSDGEIFVYTKGYGHRVGMSQYGADAMAEFGESYAQILSYYYPGTELGNLTAEDFQLLFDKDGDI